MKITFEDLKKVQLLGRKIKSKQEMTQDFCTAVFLVRLGKNQGPIKYFPRNEHTRRPAPPALTEWCCCFVSVLQMEVVSTFKRSGSFQGAVRRRSSVLSQLHDVNTISTPSHVALSTATANTSPAPGSEFAESMYTHLPHTHTHTHMYLHTLIHRHKHMYTHCCTARGLRYFYSLWLCPLRLARCSCVCNVSSVFWFFLLTLPLEQHPVPTGYVVLVWSGLVQSQCGSQARVCFVVECWFVQEAADRSLSHSFSTRHPVTRSSNTDWDWSLIKKRRRLIFRCHRRPEVQGVSSSSSCTTYSSVCIWGQA